MVEASHIWTDIDYDRPGKQVGWLHLPHSVTRSAYGTLMLPIAVVANGRGPTAFFMAGNHGDEEVTGGGLREGGGFGAHVVVEEPPDSRPVFCFPQGSSGVPVADCA